MSISNESDLRRPLLDEHKIVDDAERVEQDQKIQMIANNGIRSYERFDLNVRPVIQPDRKQTLQLSNGQYFGEIKDEEPDGSGLLTFTPGMECKRYEGSWKSGQFCGYGILIFRNGSRYEGKFERGFPHGDGVAFYADGTKIEATFCCGSLHGEGKIYQRTGEIINRTWFHGKRQINNFLLSKEKEYELFK